VTKPGDVRRGVLPIPDRPHTGLASYDARDPDAAFPPNEPLRGTAGTPSELITPDGRLRLAMGRQ
jgi:hypothetical protein